MKKVYKIFLLILFMVVILGEGLFYARYQENNKDTPVKEVISTDQDLSDLQKYYPPLNTRRAKIITQKID